MSNHLLLAATNPVPGREEEFNAWYDAHLRTLVFEGPYVRAQRFRVSDLDPAVPPSYQHLVLYEVADVDAPAARDWQLELRADRVRARAEGRGARVPISPANQAERLAWFCEPLGIPIEKREVG